jgi:hypothetical protein
MPKVCQCGGEFVLAAFTQNGWQPARREPQPKRRRAVCVLCKRQGMVPGRLRELTRPETFLVKESPYSGLVGSLFAKTPVPVQLGEGSIVCFHHESKERRFSTEPDGEPYPVMVLARREVEAI